MDLKWIPFEKQVSTFAVIVLLTASLILGSSVLTVASEDLRSARTFDMDRDGLDDRIDSSTVFPLWTFVHHNGEEAEVVRNLESTGARVHASYDLVPVVSVLFNQMEQMRSFLGSDRSSSIEMQGSISLLQDISVPAIKASRSTEYSPSTAQDLGMNGEGITIAIIDTGVDNEHPNLNGAFVAGADLSVPESPITPRDGTFDPDDRTGHGTAVASIALGRGDQEGNLRGVAPYAGLIDLKVAGNLPISLNQNAMMDSLQWCSDHADTDWGGGYSGVDIVSISLGIGDGSVAIAEAMDGLVSQGVVVVQGAGNSGSSYSSGSGTTWSDGSIVVGSVDDQGTISRDDDEIWSSSTNGPRTDDGDDDPYDELRPDVVAPGVAITFASSSRTSTIQPASGWSEGSGTSYATPHVSGTVALMLQAKAGIRPSGYQNPVKRIIHQTSEVMGEPYDSSLSSQYNVKYGFGMLDSYMAIRGAISYTGVNNRPEISYFEVNPNQTTPGTVCRVRALAVDLDEEPLEYELTVDDGELSGEAPLWDWIAPDEPGKYYFNLKVSDISGGTTTAKTSALVTEGSPNRPPVITSFRSDRDVVNVGQNAALTVVAIDQDGDPLRYDYDARMGSVQGTGDEVQYTAPDDPMKDIVTVTVTDGKGGSDMAQLEIEVQEGTTNRPPVVTLVIAEPNVINRNTSGLDKKLYAVVEDPDGPDDIDMVLADLSSIYGSSGVEMLNDGSYPDDDPNDLWYSLLLVDMQGLEDGIYTLKVTVYDMEGASDTGMTQLEINLSSSSTGSEVDIGTDTGANPVLIGVLIAVALLLVLGIATFVVMRGRRNRPQQTPPMQGAQFNVKYQNYPPQRGFPPPQGGFSPVQPR